METPPLNSIVEISHGKWTEKYLVTFRSSHAYQLTKVQLGKTKISNMRFPEKIRIEHKYNALATH